MYRDIEIKILNKRAVVPQYATDNSGGLDLCACIEERVVIPAGKTELIPTGIAISMEKMEENCVALIYPRSGAGHKEGKVLGNGTGVIDKDYQGEIFVSMLNRNRLIDVVIQPGDRIAQMVIVPIIKARFYLVDEFSVSTKRGAGGFGHTGK